MQRALRYLLPPLIALAALAQTGTRDRYFLRYPFDKWEEEAAQAQVKWTVRVFQAHLSPHQRLIARVEIEVDGREVEKRRGRGELVFFLEVTDAAGHKWRTHQAWDLRRVPKESRGRTVTFGQDAFVLPGDYRIALAVCDTQTLEHSFLRRAMHVAPLRGDPLPEAWGGMPAVEFPRLYGFPELWFQPGAIGRLRLPLATRQPVHIELLMNLTPSERASGSVQTFRRNMSILLPAMKVLCGIDPAGGSVDLTLLDMTRRVTWEQNARGLDWARIREPFASSNPGVIDVQSLAAKAAMKQFFRDQILDRAKPRATEPLTAIIVLSAPVFLGHQDQLERDNIPKDPNRRVFYLCYRPLQVRPVFVPGSDGLQRPVVTAIPTDDLEHALKGLDPRVLSASTPEQFRKAIATVLTEISRM